jgi:predicted dehydrogenase
VAIADLALAGSTLETFPELPIQRDWRALIDDPLVEAIHLAAPPAVRAEVAIPALLAGKAVFCEKPLALSLSDADGMVGVSRETGSALGVDYVMRHHPAFRLLSRLASSGVLSEPRDVSLQNFARSLPADHWMWDQHVSGGALVEHGVHFFDVYGEITGPARQVWGTAPGATSIQTTVAYAGGAIGSYYHEFAFAPELERTRALVMFERGYIEIDGWIPECLRGKALVPISEFEDVIESFDLPVQAWTDGNATHFEIRFADRQADYKSAILDGMRDLIATQRDPSRAMVVSAQDARDSLALALAAREATETGTVLQLAS